MSRSGRCFDWKSPKLSLVRLEGAEKARVMQRAVFQESLVVLIARGPCTMEALEHFVKAMRRVPEIEQPVEIDEFTQQVIKDIDVACGALSAMSGSSSIITPTIAQQAQKMMTSKAGVLLVLAHAINTSPAWREKYANFSRRQAAWLELGPELTKSMERLGNIDEVTVTDAEEAARRLPVWRDALGGGSGALKTALPKQVNHCPKSFQLVSAPDCQP